MLIVLSDPNKINNEQQLSSQIFKSGLQTFHLRKPDYTKEDYEELLKAISPENKKKVVLHQYHELATKYNVKGLHLKEENRKKLSLDKLKDLKKEMKNKNLTLSSSFHSVEEMIKYDGLFDYVFLSPVFESISKPGYVAGCELRVLGKMNKTKVIALGGIQASNILKAKEYGFDGVAVLGAIWQNPDQAIQQFEEIQKQYSSLF